MFDEQDFEEETRRLERLSPEALTLHLARQGVSPEDCKKGLRRILHAVREYERREAIEHLEDLSVEQELGLRR